MVMEGKDVAAFPYVQTPARSNFARFSVPLLTERTYLYYTKQNLTGFDFTGYDALRKYRVGTLQGFVHKELFRSNQVPAIILKDNFAGLSMLLQNRLDLFPVNDLVAKREIHNRFSDRADLFGKTKTPLYEVSLHLMVARDNPRARHILELFAKGMSIIRKNGMFAKITKSYQ